MAIAAIINAIFFIFALKGNNFDLLQHIYGGGWEMFQTILPVSAHCPFAFFCCFFYDIHMASRFFSWLLLGVSLLTVLFLWWMGTGRFAAEGTVDPLLALARLAGLGAAYFALLQVALIGRTLWVERAFGLDRLSLIHHYAGFAAIGFILVHPVLILLSYARRDNAPLLTEFFSLLRLDDIPNALMAAGLFSFIVVFSISLVRRKYKYEAWYFIHLLSYLSIALAFGHQTELGTDLASSMGEAVWISLYFLAIGSLVVFRVLVPAYRFSRHNFSVSRVVPETEEAVSIYISGKRMENFRGRPGQFVIVRFLTKKFWWQAHPFSLSMVPRGGEFRITVKNSGDFTSRIKEISPGTPVIVEGPYGTFVEGGHARKKVLFIAGGIGITPIRALFESMSGRKECVILYSNRTLRNLVFKNELEKIPGENRIHYIITEDPSWSGERGRI
jgi:predicted ferric reductase